MTTADPFAGLGLPRTFDLASGQIRMAYLARAAAVHPDTGGHNDEVAAATLNAARAVLDDPERRADALLVLFGGPTREAERALPAGFLAEMMELRERIEHALEVGDRAQMDGWRVEAQNRRAELLVRCGRLFRELPMPAPAIALRAIRVELNAWRYFERLLEQLDPAYDPTRADPLV